MKKIWQPPVLISLGNVADLTRGKLLSGTDSACGSVPDTFFPPPNSDSSSSDAAVWH